MTSPEPDRPLACPSCGQPVRAGDNFCEACRADLSPALVSGDHPEPLAQCPSCPGAPVTADGYCESCGRKVPSANDHVELELGLVAGVTDRGVRHQRNEDAMALATAQTATGPAAIAVVCDGVSTSQHPDEASRAAAQAAVQVLLSAVRGGEDVAEGSARAVQAAQQALGDLTESGGLQDNAPSATFVSAVVTGQAVTLCWLGDSRAYWLDGRVRTDSRQLTSDDSVAQQLVSAGLLTEAEALASPHGHVVTGWIGADLRGAEPHVVVDAPSGHGAVLLCSDGLWNYQSEPAAVGSAISASGSDNITAVLVPFPPHSQPASPTAPEEEPADEPV